MPEKDNPAWSAPKVQVELPSGRYSVRWFNPRTGEWIDAKAVEGGGRRTLTASTPKRARAGDWVLVLKREGTAR